MTTDPKHKRNFLWRESGPGNLIVLAAEEPKGFVSIFDISTVPFMLDLTEGDQVSLRMRVSPVIYKAVEGARRPKRHDLIMDTIYNTTGERSQIRQELVQRSTTEWLLAQGMVHGFRLEVSKTIVSGYRPLSILEPDGRKLSFSTVDVECTVEIFDVEKFLACLKLGLGGSRSFGCGLILIKK